METDKPPVLMLFRSYHSADWKSRPSDNLLLVGVSRDRAKLIEMQNADVADWQADDIAEDNEMVAAEVDVDAGEAPGDVVSTPITTWERDRERWEMRGLDGDLREFAGGYDGEFWSISYHIIPMPTTID